MDGMESRSHLIKIKTSIAVILLFLHSWYIISKVAQFQFSSSFSLSSLADAFIRLSCWLHRGITVCGTYTGGELYISNNNVRNYQNYGNYFWTCCITWSHFFLSSCLSQFTEPVTHCQTVCLDCLTTHNLAHSIKHAVWLEPPLPSPCLHLPASLFFSYSLRLFLLLFSRQLPSN